MLRNAASTALTVGLLAWAITPANAQPVRQDTAPTGFGWSWASIDLHRPEGIRCGGGGVVVGDGCAPKTADRLGGNGFGQGLPHGINSQDIPILSGYITSAKPFDRLWIQTRDAFDQRFTREFRTEIGRYRPQIVERQVNGQTTGWFVKLQRKVDRIWLRITTQRNDGYSVRARTC